MSDEVVVLGGPGAMLWCPGCEDVHGIRIEGPGAWTWDGDEVSPTISPSLLVRMRFTVEFADRVCHSFVRAGQWEFLTDSTHARAGQTVPCVPFPDAWR